MNDINERIEAAEKTLLDLKVLKTAGVETPRQALEKLQEIGDLQAILVGEDGAELFPMPWDAGYEISEDGKDLRIHGAAGPNGFGLTSTTVPLGSWKHSGYKLDFILSEGTYTPTVELLLELLPELEINWFNRKDV